MRTISKLPTRQLRRKDGRVRSRILASRPDGSVLMEARWGPKGRFKNHTVVSQDYLERRYGVSVA